MNGISAIGSGGVSMASLWMQSRYMMNLSAARAAGTNPARAETPVEPVQPVRALPQDTPVRLPVTVPEMRLPTVDDLNNASEHLARMRIQYPGEDAADVAAAEGRMEIAGLDNGKADHASALSQEAEALTDGVWESKAPWEIMEETECQTCARRKYQDGSDDPGVSFKSPTHISPEQAGSAVRGHEQEHVVREQAAAQREGREVVRQSVSIHTDICPECGRVYISGGTTETVTSGKDAEPEKLLNPEEAEGETSPAA